MIKWPTRSARVVAVAGMTTLLLVACGGGGGGSEAPSAPPAPPPATLNALPLSSANLREASANGMASIEVALGLGQLAADTVALVASKGSLEFEEVCGDSRARFKLQDADGNRVPSAGDTITVEYVRCFVGFLGDTIENGTLTIHLSAVTSAERGAAAGSLDFGAGVLTSRRADGYRLTWLGSLRFSRGETDLREEVQVSASAADDLRQSIVQAEAGGTVARVVAYQGMSLKRLLDREAARASVTGSLRLASQPLGGWLDVRLAPEMSSYFNTFADSGSVVLAGAANATIVIPAVAGPDRSTVQVALDSNGDGVTETRLTIPWVDLRGGYLWHEGSVGAAGFTSAHFADRIELISKPEWNQSRPWRDGRPLRLQFDRPLAPDTRLYARLAGPRSVWGSFYDDSNSLVPYVEGIAADVSIHGAAVLIRPRQALQWGGMYSLQIDTRSDFGNTAGVQLRDTTGAAQIDLLQALTLFNTDDRLWAAVSGAGNRTVLLPTQPITLTATAPLAAATPMRYRWEQVDGPSVTFDTPDGASTVVRLVPGGAAGTGRASLRLTITDAVGRSASQPVVIQVAQPVGLDSLLYLTRLAGAGSPLTEVHLYAAQNGQFEVWPPVDGRPRISVAFQPAADPAERSWVEAAAAGGVAPTVGRYSGAWDLWSLMSGNPATTPMLSVTPGSGSCRSESGRFEILDIAFDPSGQLVRLAMDFEQLCNLQTNVPTTLRGALRINSSLPFTP